MQKLSKKDFLSNKNSDTIVIYGCGSSIRELSDDNKQELSKFDSVGFNWFAKSGIPTTFYLVREQANARSRISKTETPKELFKLLSGSSYINSCILVHKLSFKTDLPYDRCLDKFGRGIVVNDLKKRIFKGKKRRLSVSHFKRFDVYDDGVIHGNCTLVNALHLSQNLSYKRIIFAGVDLYDSRYFWTDKRRHTIAKKGLKQKSKHPVRKYVMQAVRDFKKCYPDVKMYTYNEKSSLKQAIPVWGE